MIMNKIQFYKKRTKQTFIEPIEWTESITKEELKELTDKDTRRSVCIDTDGKIRRFYKGGAVELVASPGDIMVFTPEGHLKGYATVQDFFKDYKEVRLFTKDERSTFKYWFAHWAAYQVTALNLGVWKFKYLFHDFEKPWLKLIWPYKKLQTWHREHHRHHLAYGLKKGWDKVDYEALGIDWECCSLSKQACPLDARDTLDWQCEKEKWKPYEKELRAHIEPVLDRLGL